MTKKLTLTFCMLVFLALSAGSMAGFQTVHNVTVGPGGALTFVDGDTQAINGTTTINVGDTVKWTFASSGHTVTSALSSGPDSFNSSMNQGGVFQHTYNTPGSFFYVCLPHQSLGMTASVTVNAVQLAKFSSTAVDLGSTVLGLSSPATQVTFTNNTASPLSMQSLAINGDFTQTNNCTDPLPANSSCTINVTFKPSLVGTRNGSLTHSSATTSNLIGQGVDVSIAFTRLTRPRINSSGAGAIAQGVDLTMMNIANDAGSLGMACEGLPMGMHCRFSPVESLGNGVFTVHLDFAQSQRSRRLASTMPASVKVRLYSGNHSFVVNVPTE